MNVEFVCDSCEQRSVHDFGEENLAVVCPHCGKEFAGALSDVTFREKHLDRCGVCGSEHFYLQKDFNPKLSLLIFAVGVGFSYHTYGASVVLATLVVILLYKVVNTVTVCYGCGAVYREFLEHPKHFGFDHKLALALDAKKEEKQAPVEPVAEAQG